MFSRILKRVKAKRRSLRNKKKDFKKMSALEWAMGHLKEMSPEEVRDYNESVAKERAIKLQGLRRLLREKKIRLPLLDVETRAIARKFAKLPFGYINDSCAGHFSESLLGRKRFSLEEIGPRQRVFASGADFEIRLDLSKPALEFRERLNHFAKKFSFKSVTPGFRQIHVNGPVIIVRAGRKQAAKIREANLQVIEEFEKFLDYFVEKYGVPVKL